jgi:hypothetical protein
MVAFFLHLHRGPCCRRTTRTQSYELRHRTARLAKADPDVAAIIEALRTLGKSRATDRGVIKKLQCSLSASDKERLRRQAHLAPGWMQPILRSIATSNQYFVTRALGYSNIGKTCQAKAAQHS